MQRSLDSGGSPEQYQGVSGCVGAVRAGNLACQAVIHQMLGHMDGTLRMMASVLQWYSAEGREGSKLRGEYAVWNM
jgi:hypothetical protein